MVDCPGIEPGPTGYEPDARPSSYQSIFPEYEGVNVLRDGERGRRWNALTLHPLAVDAGVGLLVQLQGPGQPKPHNMIAARLEVEAYVWVIAVCIIKPYLMMDDQPGLLMAYLTQPAVYRHPVCDVCPPAHLRRPILCRHTKKGPGASSRSFTLLL